MNQENNTFFVGKVLQLHEELQSTNQYALNLLANSKIVEGTAIRTDFQTAGRGQIGNTWESAKGENLTLSIVFYPKFLLARQQFLFNQAVSLGVRDCITYYIDAKTYVKWSNDVYVFQKKIAGILIQNTLSGANLQSSVVGIGLNVNQTGFRSGAANPTSLALEQGNTFDLNTVMQQLFHSIEKWYLLLRAGKYDLIRNTYLENLYLFQRKARFQRADGRFFEGMIVGIDNIGRLLVLHDGATEAFGFKEIIFLHT